MGTSLFIPFCVGGNTLLPRAGKKFRALCYGASSSGSFPPRYLRELCWGQILAGWEHAGIPSKGQTIKHGLCFTLL